MATKTTENREGFFQSSFEPNLPRPHTLNPLGGNERKRFLAALDEVQSEAEKMTYKGSSTCRVCNEPNGSSEYRARGWVWPSGYRHYIAVHNVRPSLAFQEMILQERIR